VRFLYAFALFFTPVGSVPSSFENVTQYADVDARYERGALRILAVRRGRFGRPTSLPRWRGRFVAIVSKGKKSLAEVQFDFPLVAAAESHEDTSPEAQKVADQVRSGVTSSTTVRVPLPEGADTIAIWDAVTRKTIAQPLNGPAESPPAPAPAPSSPSGAPSARTPPSR
jgi:hypothetical protein